MTITSLVVGQDTDPTVDGTVSYVTSYNIYAKFGSTENIKVGDTLQLADAAAPCLIVTHKSSISVVCSLINNCEIKKGDKVYSKYIVKTENISLVESDTLNNTTLMQGQLNQREKPSRYEEKIAGRISVSSYNFISNYRDNRQRILARFSISAAHINNSKFSFESYINYRQNYTSAEQILHPQPSFVRVYNLALRFDADSTLSFLIGRKINPKAWSIGAIDGLQVEKHFGKNYIGVIAGFRPDILDYSFNPNLLQYGGYIGRMGKSENLFYETSLGFIEQKNGSETDRSYAFFQYSTTLYNNLNIFSSIQLDLFRKVNGVSSTNPRLTNLYVSARYRFNRKFNLTLSYDTRKRILYYETFQTEIERLLDDDIARQGARARVNIRPIKYVIIGFSYSKRFQSDNQNKSDNYYGYVNFSRLPGIGGRLMVSYNLNESNYSESKALSIRHSRNLIKNKLNGDIYYRWVNYVYSNSTSNFEQNYFGGNLSYNITRKAWLSISAEMSQLGEENNYRIYTKIVKRFYGKKNK